MDKHRLNKINKSFDEQYDDAFLDAHLPDLWGAISEGLEGVPISEGHTIKDSFEAEYDDANIEAALPTTLWATITQELNRPEGHTIKDGFEGVDSPEPANSIWYAVEEELEIESVWKNIRCFLDQRTQAHYWRDRLVKVSLVALALLWIRGCYSDYQPVEPIQPVTITTSQPLAAHSMGGENQANDGRQIVQTTTIEDAQQQFQTVSKVGNTVVHTTTSTPQQPHETPTTTNNTTDIVESSPNHYPDLTQFLSHLSTPLPTLWEPSLATDLHRNIPVVGSWLEGIEGEIVADKKLVEPVIAQIEVKSNEIPMHRWEIGGETRLSNSLLWGETTTKAMDATSMISMQMQTLASVGMVLAWHWSHRDALLLTAHPSVNSQQYFGGYSNEGRYYWQQIRLTRAEGTFSYQRTLWRGNFWNGQTSRLYARALYHFSHLTKGEERINDELIETTFTYQRWQHSAGLALGASQQIHRWSIDVGAHSTCGLSTMSQSAMPWNDSRLVTWGGYIGLRYHL